MRIIVNGTEVRYSDLHFIDGVEERARGVLDKIPIELRLNGSSDVRIEARMLDNRVVLALERGRVSGWEFGFPRGRKQEEGVIVDPLESEMLVSYKEGNKRYRVSWICPRIHGVDDFYLRR